MNTLGRREILLPGLALLAVLQLAVMATGGSLSPRLSSAWIQVGDTLSMVRATDAHGAPVSPTTGEPTVLLVFRSDCGHCQEVAPLWRDWIGSAGRSYRVFALTADPIETASAFVTQYGLDAQVVTVDGRFGRGEAHFLLARTPWVFLLDGEGVIQAQGHGSQIGKIPADDDLELVGVEDR